MNATTVILAAGDFPKKGDVAWRLLVGAKRVVACDGAANAYRRRFGKWPAVIVGDFDSLRRPRSCTAELVCVPDQDTNDLEKAMALCASRGWRHPVIVGATGRREDHTIGNVFRALAGGCEIVSDTGRFIPVTGTLTVRAPKGTAVSVFAPDSKTKMTSRGLEWPLDDVVFDSLYRATLNRTSAARFTVASDRPVMVYVEARRG